MKWLALGLMTADHINPYLLDGAMPALYGFGRVAFPLFAFVLAYNLARPGASASYARAMRRMAVFGALATLPFVLPQPLRPNALPLNIMFTFILAIAVITLITSEQRVRRIAGVALFVCGGGLVEYPWVGVAIVVSMFWFLRTGAAWALMLWLILHALALPLQALIFYHAPLQYGMWAIAAILVVPLLARTPISVPRMRWIFYAYYPGHLLAFWAIRFFG